MGLTEDEVFLNKISSKYLKFKIFHSKKLDDLGLIKPIKCNNWTGNFFKILDIQSEDKSISFLLHLLLNIKLNKSFLIKDFLIKKSLNGFVLIDLNKKIVIKCLDKKLEPNFLVNEQQASKIYPELVIKNICLDSIENFQVLISPYIRARDGFNLNSWGGNLKIILPNMHRQLLEGGALEFCSISSQLREFDQSFENSICDLLFLTNEISTITEICKNIINLLGATNDHSLKIFSHGDLMPSNAISMVGGDIKLIDWANGGWHNFMYDLVITNIYMPDSIIWKNFANIKIEGMKDSQVFFGQFYCYEKLYNSCYDVGSANIYKINIIISIMEFSIKNLIRYQSVQWAGEGRVLLSTVIKLLNNIINSFGIK